MERKESDSWVIAYFSFLLETLSVIRNIRLYHIPSPLWSLHFEGLYEDINNRYANEEGGIPPGDLNSTEKTVDN